MKDIKRNIKLEIRKKAEKNIQQKLNSNGLTIDDISLDEFERLVKSEVKLLTKNVKNVGVGLAIGTALTMFFGF
jgi:hypothetical protein